MTRDPVADAFRRWGYLQADLDPLGRLEPLPHPDLDEIPKEAAAPWRSIYAGPIGAEFMHIPDAERSHWFAERMEAPPAAPDRERLLRRLAEAEIFERFLHARYVGTKRYSLEGSAALVPLLDAVLDAAAGAGSEVAIIGMSHRGRLCVMLNVVGVPPAHLFAGFEDVDPRSVLGSGDVKYHKGATGTWTSPEGRRMDVHLVSNPSHLEAVDPVMTGRAHARQVRMGAGGKRKAVPITLHGDAAFAGQGIASETLNMAALRGYDVGGTIHVIVNNLIGFTTSPPALHSTRYSSDAAKRLAIPVIHVNGEVPEAVVRAGRLALEYRHAFGSDVVVDLIGYRRYGHSEVDDPTITQPLLYRKIERRPLLWLEYAEKIGAGPDRTRKIQEEIEEALQRARDDGRAMEKMPPLRTLPSYWDPYTGGKYDPSMEVPTAIDPGRLLEIARGIVTVPGGFHLHHRVRKILDERAEMAAGRRPVDWGTAEALAFGSLLLEGLMVRLSGQDSRRGTFGQRHAVLIDTETEAEHTPLSVLAPSQAPFEVHDSPLSEASVLGFEYGFSRDWPDGLICWEAQFGDFANGAQIIIDQFISAGEDKWYLLSGLVMLLPHGYEGQGPEHSSARLERFLQVAGEDNIQVCQPTTAAQYFHLLRRQAIRKWRKPLVVMTPKSLLRSPAASSPLEEFASGSFRAVIPDTGASEASRVLVCSGKIAHEMRAERSRRNDTATAIVRLEQIYPFPARELEAEIARHSAAREVIWVQEEPGNKGALFFVMPELERIASGRRVTSVKRSASASPATGSTKAHAIEQKVLVDLAFARFG